ncbi:MAG: hypothetical protein JXA61_07345 [Bacteroidales bacterium]|nr:hypothetical protein [Bacteroidales bacterium]
MKEVYTYHPPSCRKIFLAAVLAVFMNHPMKAQFDVKLLEDVRMSFERVYVHLDKMVYGSGGTVKYRAFLADANSTDENIKSSILYFELKGTDQVRSALWRVNLKAGYGSGSFVIPYDLKSGVYSLKVFTNRMRNGNPDYLFSTDILIVNISEENISEIPVAVRPDEHDVLIEFHPEGGNLVCGIESKVGYTLHRTHNDRLPVYINIMANDSVELTRIIPGGSGTGWFSLLPANGNIYHASLFYENGQIVNVNLPYAEPYGTIMQVSDAGEGLALRISIRNGNISRISSMHLMAVSRGSIVLDSVFSAYDGEQIIFIPGERLSKGVISFYLYDSRRFSLCRRLYYFTGSGPDPAIRLQGIGKVYKQNELVSPELWIDGLEEKDSVSMAVSVSQLQPFQHILDRCHIDQYFLLLSEIADLPVPMSHLDGIDEGQLSDLLLCVDTEDYAWNYSNKNISSGCLYKTESNGFILTGNVKTRQGGEPLASADILITVTDSIAPRIIYTKTDTAGYFNTVLNSFYDNKEIILQVCNDIANQDLSWELEEKRIQTDVQKAAPYIFTDAEKEYANSSRDIRITEAIYDSPGEEQQRETAMRSEMVFLSPDAVIYPSDFTELVNFKEIADNILPSVRFTTRNRQYITGVFNRPYEYWLMNDKVMLNGVLFKDLAYIAALGSKDIERIEIYNTNLLCGPLTIPGLISVYTYDREIPENYLRDHTFAFYNEVIPGDQKRQNLTFHGKPYNNPEYPDFRQTLFWNPDIEISGSDKMVFEFRTSQLRGLFEINIQGISKSGIPMHANFYFRVE